MVKKQMINTALVFGISTVFCLVVLLVDMLISNGAIASSFFHHDAKDTGMDFFNSIAIVKDKTPYSYSCSIYPPLASLIFYIIYCLVPLEYSSQWRQTTRGIVQTRGTELDPRCWQTTMMAFIIFIIIATLLVFLFSKKILKDTKYSTLVSWCVVLSYGCLWAFQRGNIILLSLAFLLMFFALYKSNSKINQEVGLVCLAISAGIKLYPAIFGLILIFEKEYRKAVRAFVYGIIFLFLPFFMFEGVSVIGYFFDCVFSFAGFSPVITNEVTLGGSSLDDFVKTIVYFCSVLGKGDFNSWYNQISWLTTLFKLIICLMGIYVGGVAKEKWEKVLSLTMVLFLVNPPGGYGAVFAIPMLLFFVYENQDYKKLLSDRSRGLVFFCMLLLVEPFPVLGNFVLNEQVVSARELYIQGVTAILYGYIVFKFVKYMKLSWKCLISKVMIVLILASIVVVTLYSKVLKSEPKLEEYDMSEHVIFDSKLIHFDIDEAVVQDGMIYVTGWCILKGDEQHYNLKSPKQLLLKDLQSNKYYKMITDKDMRQDVTDSLVNDGVNYDYSGFIATMFTEKLDQSGLYELFISYTSSSEEYLESTGYVWDGKNISKSKSMSRYK